jgi:peptidylprolyl isomerase
MKVLALTLALCASASLALYGCGNGGNASSSQGTSSEPILASARPPHVSVPAGPPPTKLKINDIKQGAGAEIQANRKYEIATRYVAVSYTTDRPFEVEWSETHPFEMGFGPGLEVKGWEKGLVGMKAGGRRKLIVPSAMAYQQGALVYVIDLLSVQEPSEGRVAN